MIDTGHFCECVNLSDYIQREPSRSSKMHPLFNTYLYSNYFTIVKSQVKLSFV